MGTIRIFQGKSKSKNRKPGWAKEQAEYEAWLKSVTTMSTNFARTPKPKTVKAATAVVQNAPVVEKERLNKAPSLSTFGGAGTKPVNRPELMYRDDPEMLERELKARERKFNVAPAYNKGPTIFVSEEEITNQLVGGRRR